MATDRTKTKQQNQWGPWGFVGAGMSAVGGWLAYPFKTDKGTLIQPPGGATFGSGALEGRNPYDYIMPGMPSFRGGFGMMNGRPWPGTFYIYRIMLSDPTIALARASLVAPILAGSWTYEADEKRAPKEAAELLQRSMEPIRNRLLMGLLRAIDYGYQPAEQRWDDLDGYRVPALPKFLIPDLTQIRVDEHGEFAGLENGGIELDASECLLFTHDREGDNHYGRSRLENIRREWANYKAIEDQSYQLIRKASGHIPKVMFPSDSRASEDGTSANLQTAKAIAQAMVNMQPICMENFAGLSTDRPEEAAALADKSDWSADVIDMGDTGPAQQAALEFLRYYDALKVRGYLRSERSVIEAQASGSRADSETHTASIADTDADLVHAAAVEVINEQIVDAFLVENFGPKAKGTVKVQAREMVDERRAAINLFAQAVYADPAARAAMFERVDMESVVQYLGLKMREDAEPWPDVMPTSPEGQQQQQEHQDEREDIAAERDAVSA